MSQNTPAPESAPASEPQPTTSMPALPAPTQGLAAQPVPPTMVQPPVPPPVKNARPGGRRLWWLAAGGAAVALIAVGGISYAIGVAQGPRDFGGMPMHSVPGRPAPQGVGPGQVGTNGDSPMMNGGPASGSHGRAGHGGGHRFDSTATLDIDDQAGDGSSVRIASVRISTGSGFVVIHDEAGAILGSAPVTSGAQPVTVPITMDVAPGTEVELVGSLWLDNGDGVFDPTTDRALVADGRSEPQSEDFDYQVR